MEINNFFSKNFEQLTILDISDINDFSSYDNFKQFILDHYQLDYMKKNNYIKYVKVKRQILKLLDERTYMYHINMINKIITIMAYNNVFPNVDIKKYMYKISAFFKLIETKRDILENTIKTLRKILNIKQFKIITAINTLMYKLKIFNKYSKQLIYHINLLINFEIMYDIDYKLIEIKNDLAELYTKMGDPVAANSAFSEFSVLKDALLSKAN